MSTGLTKTSYAILGLLNIQPWTTYELAQQMERSLKNFWPRAQSVVYEEPKRLAKLGYAKPTKDTVGRRPRTTYAITAKGRRALAAWLAAPTESAPLLEFEALLKVFYGEQAAEDDVLAAIASMAAWAERQTEENVAFARFYRDEMGPFPDRRTVIALTGQFMVDFADMVRAWSAWADATVRAPNGDVLRRVATRVLDSHGIGDQDDNRSRRNPRVGRRA